jgi:hypothetical protein
LEYLRLNTGSIVSLNGIEALKNLKELMLMQLTKLEDIKELGRLTQLRYMLVYNCRRVQSIDLVKKMGISKLEIVGTTPD